jgi:hypothetical protein
MSKNLLDLMPEDERKKAITRAHKRIEHQRSRKGLDVSPEIYLVAEFGYYFGWDAMMAVRRGYTVVPVTNEKEVFTLEEALILLEGARKVWYSKLVEQSHGNMVGSSAKFSQNPGQAFNNGVRPFTDRAEITE